MARENSYVRARSGFRWHEGPRERKVGKGVKLRWLIYCIQFGPLPRRVYLFFLFAFSIFRSFAVESSGDLVVYIRLSNGGVGYKPRGRPRVGPTDRGTISGTRIRGGMACDLGRSGENPWGFFRRPSPTPDFAESGLVPGVCREDLGLRYLAVQIPTSTLSGRGNQPQSTRVGTAL